MASNNLFPMALFVALMLVLQGCTTADRYEAELKNPSLCDKKSTQDERLDCFRAIILEANKPEYCEYYSGNKADCYTKAGIALGDQKVCDRIADQAERYKCIGIVAGDTAVENLLTLIEGKDKACVEACSNKKLQCTSACASAYSYASQNCKDIGEITPDPLSPCEEKATDDQNECMGRCGVDEKACVEKC